MVKTIPVTRSTAMAAVANAEIGEDRRVHDLRAASFKLERRLHGIKTRAFEAEATPRGLLGGGRGRWSG
jgi:hypothetical protein